MVRSPISTRSPLAGLPLVVSIKFQILFHPPHRGAFHLSLAVLVRYRSPNLFSLGKWSSQLQAGFHVSDPTQENITTCLTIFTYGTITLCGGPFQAPLANRKIYCCNIQIADGALATPLEQRL